MDYKCECGEEFDVFDEFSTNYFTTLGENDKGETCLLACYDVVCPHCGRKYQVQEEHEYKGTTIYAY